MFIYGYKLAIKFITIQSLLDIKSTNYFYNTSKTLQSIKVHIHIVQRIVTVLFSKKNDLNQRNGTQPRNISKGNMSGYLGGY